MLRVFATMLKCASDSWRQSWEELVPFLWPQQLLSHVSENIKTSQFANTNMISAQIQFKISEKSKVNLYIVHWVRHNRKNMHYHWGTHNPSEADHSKCRLSDNWKSAENWEWNSKKSIGVGWATIRKYWWQMWNRLAEKSICQIGTDTMEMRCSRWTDKLEVGLNQL